MNDTMHPESTLYAAFGAVGAHLLLFVIAGSIVLNQPPTPLPPPKPYKLEMIEPPPVPPAKKPEAPPAPAKPQPPTALPRQAKLEISEAVPLTDPSAPKVMKPLPVDPTTPQQAIQINTEVARITPPDVKMPQRVLFEKTIHTSRTGSLQVSQTNPSLAASANQWQPRTQTVVVASSGARKGSSLISGSGPTGLAVPIQTARKFSPEPSTGKTKGIARTRMVSADSKIVETGFLKSRPAPAMQGGNALDGYAQGIKQKIESEKKYPPRAKRLGNEGTVVIRFTILKNGNITDIEMVSGSKYKSINEAALKAVRKAAPFPHLPDEIGRDSLKLVLPFNFELTR
ncbi:MAG: energy transducer TonB [Candidatus Nitrohelix vancouverensis]|uniref:Energy transducer TonB n=1 Tax=Candidatus Nitrohelix vancouverensis TaxID=2705534 RepID=A0A7T0C063_9BACT|nr:MAG: energy transducer TonB [Candidatus Nitrohelix vancouverensis]